MLNSGKNFGEFRYMELSLTGREGLGRCDNYRRSMKSGKFRERAYLKFSDPTVKMGLSLPPSQNQVDVMQRSESDEASSPRAVRLALRRSYKSDTCRNS